MGGALSNKWRFPVWLGDCLAGGILWRSKRSIVHFGASTNDPPKSIELNWWQTNRSLGQMERIGILVNVQLNVTLTRVQVYQAMVNVGLMKRKGDINGVKLPILNDRNSNYNFFCKFHFCMSTLVLTECKKCKHIEHVYQRFENQIWSRNAKSKMAN
ncbi:hypothetical protein AVEN_79358-1 [Araneus ventricosus]|uniref:Uncharacterized protein n=1 Tax=Araneus ventricosus TaxID=182803 RepID=A0A4Y2UP66_ARAVE|nr:hypothetical protein AVEN_79358-1 [Araneus ventricosus]